MVPEITWHLLPGVWLVTVRTICVWFDRPLQVPTMLLGQEPLAEAAEVARHPATIASAAI